MNDTELKASSNGTIALKSGDAVKLALDIPNNDATGLAQTPTQAPVLQHAKNRGMIELILPLKVVQIDFNFFILSI